MQTMIQRDYTYLCRAVVAAAVAIAAWWVCGGYASGQQKGDPFDAANQARVDPFSTLNQAPPVLVGEDTPKKDKDLSKDDNPKAREAPRNISGVQDLIDFEVTVMPKEVRRGTTTRVTVTGMPRKGYYTYAMTRATPDQAVSTFKISPTPGLKPLGPIEESPPLFDAVEDAKGTKFYWKHKKPFTWSFDVLVERDAPIGPAVLPIDVALQVCSTSCYNGTIRLAAVLTVQGGEAAAVNEQLANRAAQKFPPPLADEPVRKTEEPEAKTATIPRDYQASLERVRKQFLAPQSKLDDGLWKFVLTGVFWGFVSLITPCVFPMIPITVSFFLKQSEKEHHKPVTMAAVYCGTIVLVLTIAAAALLNFFRVLSISPVMNFGLGLLFIFFALSLFGMYEIELPSFLARFTSERESKGGMVGTIFMALTFTIISFACVAPFLGGFGGTADTATRPFWQTILGGLAFSVTFASPFFILALFPTLLKAMPKSGSWLNSVKVVMGFLELAAALKFFRAGELVLSSPLGLFTFDLVLGLWIALCVFCGLYLLGVYRLPHDSPAEHLTVPRMLFAFVFVGLGLYLLPALFVKAADGEEARPNGAIFAWVNSFLLPEPRAGKGESWTPNLEDAIAQAREYRQRTGKTKLVFIDFTGEVCTNCSLNENNVFSKAEIQKLFKPYVLVRLYSDSIPAKYYAAEDRAAAHAGRRQADATLNADFEKAIFNTAELPLYAILEPLPDGTIKVLGQFGGLIRSDAEFAEFLKQPQQALGANVASR